MSKIFAIIMSLISKEDINVLSSKLKNLSLSTRLAILALLLVIFVSSVAYFYGKGSSTTQAMDKPAVKLPVDTVTKTPPPVTNSLNINNTGSNSATNNITIK